MDLQKIKNLSAEELTHNLREANEQIFRVRFQAKLGQTESISQLRSLRKDIARIKTVQRQHDLGIATAPSVTERKPKAKKSAAKAAPAKKAAAKKSAAKKSTKKAAVK